MILTGEFDFFLSIGLRTKLHILSKLITTSKSLLDTYIFIIYMDIYKNFIYKD